MDFDKLSLSDKIVLGGAAAFTIAMFLPWFKFEAFGFSQSIGGFSAGFLAFLPWLISLAMGGHVLITHLKPEQELPDLPVPWGQAHLIGGGVAAALVLLRMVTGPQGYGTSLGLYLALIAAGALAYGGFLKNGEEETGGGAAAPPAPPTEF